jgi:hypothetical protein
MIPMVVNEWVTWLADSHIMLLANLDKATAADAGLNADPYEPTAWSSAAPGVGTGG